MFKKKNRIIPAEEPTLKRNMGCDNLYAYYFLQDEQKPRNIEPLPTPNNSLNENITIVKVSCCKCM